MTDIHSHILPGMDDGSKSVEESLALLRMEKAQGIDTVIATPHFYARYDSPERFLARREEAAERLRSAMEDQPGLPEVFLGAEVHYFPGICESDQISALTIDGKRCILIEMPPSPWTPKMYRELEGLYTRQNLLPIVAHVDRYIGPMRTYGIPRQLAELPLLVQANAAFFLRWPTAAMAGRMLKAGQIHLLGSDCHNLDSRKPNLGEAVCRIEKKLGREALDRISVNEQMIWGADARLERNGMSL